MIIEKTHKNGGYLKLQFENFFSEMSSADCRDMLHRLINDYEMDINEVDDMFQIALVEMKSTKKKIHLLNSYKIFRREYFDGIV